MPSSSINTLSNPLPFRLDFPVFRTPHNIQTFKPQSYISTHTHPGHVIISSYMTNLRRIPILSQKPNIPYSSLTPHRTALELRLANASGLWRPLCACHPFGSTLMLSWLTCLDGFPPFALPIPPTPLAAKRPPCDAPTTPPLFWLGWANGEGVVVEEPCMNGFLEPPKPIVEERGLDGPGCCEAGLLNCWVVFTGCGWYGF